MLTWFYTNKERFDELNEPIVAAALDPRVSSNQVARTMMAIYSASRPAMVHERANAFYKQSRKKLSKTPQSRIGSEYENWPQDDGFNRYYFGKSDPFLAAELVDHFCFDVIDRHCEIAYWERPELKDVHGEQKKLYFKVETLEGNGSRFDKLTCSEYPLKPEWSVARRDYCDASPPSAPSCTTVEK